MMQNLIQSIPRTTAKVTVFKPPTHLGRLCPFRLTREYRPTTFQNQNSIEQFDIFSQHTRPVVTVNRFTEHGFHITQSNKHIYLQGPVILLDGRAILWDVPHDVGKWNPDMLLPFTLIRNKPELVVFGTGESIAALPLPLRDMLVSLGINVDISSTRNACSTFNVLIGEGRNVGACLLSNGQSCPLKLSL